MHQINTLLTRLLLSARTNSKSAPWPGFGHTRHTVASRIYDHLHWPVCSHVIRRFLQHPDAPGMHNMASGGDSYTRVSYRQNQGYLSRVGGSIMGIFVGFGIVCASCCLLFFNEGRAVRTAQSLDEGLRLVQPLTNLDVAFDHNNGKLVHLTGQLQTNEVLSDSLYGVAVTAVKLRRKVEMYQWVEHSHTREFKEGSQTRTETTYTYSKEWRSNVVNSGSFNSPYNHQNPGAFLIESKTYTAPSVQVGNFYLSQNLVGSINKYRKLEPTTPPSDPKIQLFAGIFYHGRNPQQPEVGDMKVSFEYAGLSGKQDAKIGPPDHVSIIAKQMGSQLTKYETNAGNDLEILYEGQFTAQQIFDQEQASNTMLTWALRFAGWFIMFVGFGFMTSIVTTIVDWLPIVREIVSLGVAALNITLSISLSLTVIALGWIRYRPLLGFTILAMAAAPFVLQKMRVRAQEKKYNRNH